MKKFLYSMVVFILMACHQDLPAQLVNDGIGGPLLTVEGKRFRFDQYRGKWIIVNFWASWCAPCREEIPALEAFYQKHKNTDAIVLGVNYDELNPVQTYKILKSLGIHFPVTTTNPLIKMGDIKEVRVIPTTFIINPQGYLVKRLEQVMTPELLEDLISNQEGSGT